MRITHFGGVILSCIALTSCLDASPLEPNKPTLAASIDEDVTPPTIRSAWVTPTQIDASAGPVQLTFFVDASDDLAGMLYCVTGFYNPVGQYASATSVPVAGSPMQGQTMLPQYAAGGTWSWTFTQCYDLAGNRTTYEPGTAPAGWVAPSFVVTSAGDVTPPQITGMALSSTVIDVSAGPVTIDVTAQASDDLSGIAYCSLGFISANGQYAWANLTGEGGTVTAEMTVLQYAEAGRWSWFSTECYDRVGNRVQYSNAADLPFPAPYFDVVSAQDITPPVLTGVTVTPLVVDASAGPAIVTVNVAVTDDASGMRYCVTGFDSPSFTQYVNTLVTTNGADTVTGDITIPQYAENGRWTWQFTECYDNAGNRVQYSRNLPGPFASPYFDVISSPDALLAALIARVHALHPANETSLVKKLEAAAAAVARGSNVAAANQLNAFRNELAALSAAGRVSAAVADELTSKAQAIVELIRSGP